MPPIADPSAAPGFDACSSALSERAVVVGYRFASWLLGVVPLAISLPLAGGTMRLAYAAWPAKRRIILANASHILGRPADDPAVKRLAGRIYQTYARYIVELMRLPSLPADAPAAMIDPRGARGIDAFAELWAGLEAEGRGIIAVSSHIGSIEALIAACAARGFPTYGLADDSAYPELFALLNPSVGAGASRSSPGGTCGASSACCASRPCWAWSSTGATAPTVSPSACSGTGRRCPPVPRCWPPGPTRSSCPSSAAGRPTVASRPSGSSRSRSAAATRPRSRAPPRRSPTRWSRWSVRAPEQWYTFKPIWPATPAEAAALAAARRRDRARFVTPTQSLSAGGAPWRDLAGLSTAGPAAAPTLPRGRSRLVPRSAGATRPRAPQPDAHLRLARGRGTRHATCRPRRPGPEGHGSPRPRCIRPHARYYLELLRRRR